MPDIDQLEGTLINLVLAFNSQRQSILNKYDVGEAEVSIIDYLSTPEMRKMKEIGEHFQIKLSTLTSTIDKLEKSKLVRRKNSKEDRRVIYIRPTSKGEKMLEELSNYTRELSEKIAHGMDGQSFQAMVHGLNSILPFLNN